MGLGTEWIIDAAGCTADTLRSEALARAFVDEVMRELSLTAAKPPMVHVFPGEGGLTAMVLLTESHFAMHTFPEHGAMTVNLYCCKDRPSWNWQAALGRTFGATSVQVTRIARGETQPAAIVSVSTDRAVLPTVPRS